MNGMTLKDQRGAVLVTGLAFLAILSVLGTTAYLTSTTELKVSANYRAARQAFYDAEAGIDFAVAYVENGLANGTHTLDTVVFPSTPSGFSFTLSPLTKVGTYYTLVSTGASGTARRTIETHIVQDPMLGYGVFGNSTVDLKSSSHVYSFDSRDHPNPVMPADNTHEADVGSNAKVIVHNGTDIDGNVGLGDDGSGTEAVLVATGAPQIEGTSNDVPRVDPDPMGAVGGSLAQDFIYYSDPANNDNAAAGIVGNTISLSNGDSMTLPAGNYYVSSIELKTGSTLTVQDGVNIYLTGGLDAKNGSTINVSGDPTGFTLYSNSTAPIVFKHGSAFKGAVYAPYASVELKNSSDVYGLVWANTVDIKHSGEFYFDVALMDKWKSSTVTTMSWRDVRN